MTLADGNATADADFDSTTATTTILAGTTSAVATVAIINDTDDELDETFSVKLVSATNATIAPAASSSTVTITDDDVPVVSIEAATAVDEGAGPATLSVTADRPVAQDVVVTYMTVADGNATANVDFTSTTATTTIAAGTTSTTATVAIESDTIDELNETFSVKLVSATNATIDPAASSSTVTITDDDVPVVSIEAGRNVGEELGPVMLSVTADQPVAQDVVVTYMTLADGNATADADFFSTTTTTTIAAGTTSATATVAIINDTVPTEPNETFSVKLVSTTNATINPAAATSTVTIIDDDQEITVQIPLAAGFNLIGIPVTISATTTALDLWKLMDAQGIQVKSISGWAVFVSQVFTTWDPLFPGTSNIPIELGRGYFVDVAQAANFSITGPPLGASVPLNLVPGFNLVGVPFQTPAGGYTTVNFGQLIADAGGNLRSISGWAVFVSQVFTTWDPVFPGTSTFNIDNISGLFVDMADAVTVNP